MGKIDTTKIEGYDNMTSEQKLAALEAYETEDSDFAGYMKKDVFDKTASELASVKKQLREKMTVDEQKEAERAAKEAERDVLLASLQKDKAISENKVQFLSLGYDPKLADETALALADGNMAKVFYNQQRHLEAVEKKIRADVLRDTPNPGKDTVLGAVDYQKKIAEAQQNGDMSAAAYYTRLAAQEEATPTT